MTLPELCDPLFQHMCRLNRTARKSVGLDGSAPSDQAHVIGDEAQVRGRDQDDLRRHEVPRLGTPGLYEQYNKVRLALVFFCDYVIKNGALAFAADWKPMAEVDEDPPRFAYYQEFFDLLDATLREQGEAADERLQVFYTCIGLGFKGYFENDPQTLRRKMKEIGGRLRNPQEAVDDTGRITPEAYANTDTRDLIQPVGRSLAPMVVALVGLLVALVVVNVGALP